MKGAIALPLLCALLAVSVDGRQFSSAEHVAIGDTALLTFPGKPPVAGQLLKLENGKQFTYGDILALGGDFFGIVDKAICDGKDEEDRMKRFMNAYNTLAVEAASDAEAILKIIDDSYNDIVEGMKKGKTAHQVYSEISGDLEGKYNVATGGGSDASPLIPFGRYLQLADFNWDHFLTRSENAYKAGHLAALKQAQVAFGSNDTADLEKAYTLNAFADHFLSDAFAAGHTRAPRKELYEQSTPDDLGSYLSKYMHDEDNRYGLNVTNLRGESWKTYGDNYYFDTDQTVLRDHVNRAVQASVDEVYATFLSGLFPSNSSTYDALSYIPTQASVFGHSNYAPLFALDKNKACLRRSDINNLNDWSLAIYWAWETWLKLESDEYDPKPGPYVPPSVSYRSPPPPTVKPPTDEEWAEIKRSMLMQRGNTGKPI